MTPIRRLALTALVALFIGLGIAAPISPDAVCRPYDRWDCYSK